MDPTIGPKMFPNNVLGSIGMMESKIETTLADRGYIGIMEKKMEAVF